MADGYWHHDDVPQSPSMNYPRRDHEKCKCKRGGHSQSLRASRNHNQNEDDERGKGDERSPTSRSRRSKVFTPVLSKSRQVCSEPLLQRDEQIHGVVSVDSEVLKEAVRLPNTFGRQVTLLGKQVNDLCCYAAGHRRNVTDGSASGNGSFPPNSCCSGRAHGTLKAAFRTRTLTGNTDYCRTCRKHAQFDGLRTPTVATRIIIAGGVLPKGLGRTPAKPKVALVTSVQHSAL